MPRDRPLGRDARRRQRHPRPGLPALHRAAARPGSDRPSPDAHRLPQRLRAGPLRASRRCCPSSCSPSTCCPPSSSAGCWPSPASTSCRSATRSTRRPPRCSLGIFVASQAPVLFSRDLRHGTISLYLARPLRSSAYALSRWVSLLGATLVFLLLPILILYAVALLGELDVGRADPTGRHRARPRPAARPLARRHRRSHRVVVDPPWLRRGGHHRPARHRQRHRHGGPGDLAARRGAARSARSPGCSRRTRSTAA